MRTCLVLVLSGELDRELGPSASQPSASSTKAESCSSSVCLQQKHEVAQKGTFNFYANAVCSRQLLVLLLLPLLPTFSAAESSAFVTCVVQCQLRVRNLRWCYTAQLSCSFPRLQ